MKQIFHLPGCINTDLFTKNDMFYENNSQNCRFIEECDWKYTKEFVVDELGEKTVLYFEGLIIDLLDIRFVIYMNGQKVFLKNR